METFYDTLGVSPTAEAEVIQAAYRALMRKYHPDANGGRSSDARAKRINEAYATLSDPSLRAAYDARTREKSGWSGAPEPEPAPQWEPQATPSAPSATDTERTTNRAWGLGVLALGVVIAARVMGPPSPSTQPPQVQAAQPVPDAQPTSQSPAASSQGPWAAYQSAAPVGADSSPPQQAVQAGSIAAPTEIPASAAPAPPTSSVSDNDASAATEGVAPNRPDTSGLTAEERSSLESACSTAKLVQGPGAYYQCVRGQLSQLATATRPNLSQTTYEERTSIESACSTAKLVQGPAAYYRCVSTQVVALGRSAGRPDLSRLNGVERDSIESACSTAKLVQGPAAYYACLRSKLAELN